MLKNILFVSIIGWLMLFPACKEPHYKYDLAGVSKVSSFIHNEIAKLKQDERSLYDSINDKLIVLRQL